VSFVSSVVNRRRFDLLHRCGKGSRRKLMPMRRARGALLRFVRRRPMAIAAGASAVALAAWLELSGRYGDWWVDGLSLVLGATGVAILWTGIAGVRPDWIDDV
jgi:hypothetical protein